MRMDDTKILSDISSRFEVERQGYNIESETRAESLTADHTTKINDKQTNFSINKYL